MSSILSSDDLNDFISPSVACIKPIETVPVAPPTDGLEVSFNNDDPLPEPSAAKISLTDCLACSGCVTSAEAILVSLQSHNEVLTEIDSGPALRISSNGSIENLGYGGRIYIASVSPQSRASLAATFGVSQREAGYMIEQLLSGPQGIKNRAVYRNRFEWVIDTNVARDICLVLGAEEVVEAMQKKDELVESRSGIENSEELPKYPILTSSCPGWICYVEKTHPHILPHLSRLKSPQALLGTLLKTSLSKKLGISPDQIWHLAIMPCFDKKLEASREELTDIAWGSEGKGIRDVDSVITSKELLMLAETRRIDFSKLPRSPVSRVPFPDSKLNSFLFPCNKRNGVREAGTSGGNLYYILNYFVSQYEGATIKTTRGRNADVLEYTIILSTGEVLLKAARYYGFRNIQNLVRRLKPSKISKIPGGMPAGSARKQNFSGKTTALDYSYIEVMACPGGCTNGGGQVKSDDPIILNKDTSKVILGPQTHKDWLFKVDEAYFSDEETTTTNHTSLLDGISPVNIKDLLAYWTTMTGIDPKKLVYTTYREVVSDVGKNVGEIQNVINIAGKVGGGW
ncbi:Cytosolic Fe-S cluster assembly factor [Podosphaera aphanis]|nr:Cytosolic Fe-S cluster assembly factor [Podosphaera aphanis]